MVVRKEQISKEGRPYGCNFCGKSLTGKNQMSVHIKLHIKYADYSGINPNRKQTGFIDAICVAKLLEPRIKSVFI